PGLSPHQSWTSSHRLAKSKGMSKSLFPFYKERKRGAMAPANNSVVLFDGIFLFGNFFINFRKKYKGIPASC
ncbi:MAG TPA: hypothetical protein PLC81_11510, partial [Bacteroidales bacterium]|nr:hypothetical protein [Bacteroidales bacterium]